MHNTYQTTVTYHSLTHSLSLTLLLLHATVQCSMLLFATEH